MNDWRGWTIAASGLRVARLERQGPVVSPSILILMLACILGGCTTLKPIDVDAVKLREGIRSGETIKAGNTIRAITIDGSAHLLQITAVNDAVITGHSPGAAQDAEETALPIDEIVLVEVSRLSSDNPRRFATGAGIGAVVGLILFAIVSP